jgi:hypothetical protein
MKAMAQKEYNLPNVTADKEAFDQLLGRMLQSKPLPLAEIPKKRQPTAKKRAAKKDPLR